MATNAPLQRSADPFAYCLSRCLFCRVRYRYGRRTELTEAFGAGIVVVPAVWVPSIPGISQRYPRAVQHTFNF